MKSRLFTVALAALVALSSVSTFGQEGRRDGERGRGGQGGGRDGGAPNRGGGGGGGAPNRGGGAPPNVNRGGGPPPNVNRGGGPPQGGGNRSGGGGAPNVDRGSGAPNVNRAPANQPNQPSQRNFQSGPRGGDPARGGNPVVRQPNVQRPPNPTGRNTVNRPNNDRMNQQRPNLAQPNSNPGNPGAAQGRRPDGNRQTFAQPGNPNVGRPGGARPGGDRPGGDRPGGDRPGGNRPGGVGPGGDGRGPNLPNVARPDGGRPNQGGRPDIARPGGNPPGANRPNGGGPDAGRREVNRPNFDRRPGDGNVGDRGPNRGPGDDRNRPGGDRGRDVNRPDGRGPNVVDRDRDNRPDGRPGGGRGEFGRRPGDRPGDRDFNARHRDGRPNDWQRNFVNRNYRNGGVANFNHSQHWNNTWNRSPNWNNHQGDWRRSNWYSNYWRGGYRPNYSPWFGTVPGLGWNWGGWGWGWGWPQWGWGYGGWGGYGYGYGSTNAFVQAPTTTIVYQPTTQQLEYAQSYYDSADQAFQEGRYDDAVTLCQHAMVDNPRSPEIVLLMAQSLFATGQYDRAADAVRMAIEVLPQDKWGQVLVNYTHYYPDVQRYTDQLRALETAARGGGHPALNFLLGYQYAYLNYPQQAVTQLDRALDGNPQDSAALKLRNAFASAAGAPERPQAQLADAQRPALPPTQQGEQSAQQPAAVASPSEEQQQSAGRFINSGEEAMRAGNFQEALSQWQHALVDTPQNGAVLLLMGQALMALGQYQDAAGAVQMGMQLVPEQEWDLVVKNFAQLYADPAVYASQLKALEAARDAKPDDPALRFLLGYQYGNLGYKDVALRELDKGLQLQPQDEGAKNLREQFAANASATPVAGAPSPGQ